MIGGVGGVMIGEVGSAGGRFGTERAVQMAGLRAVIVLWSLFPVGLLRIVARDRRVVIGYLLRLIALYPLSAVWSG